jgi:hypothetical protein
MVGTFADVVIADAIVKDVKGFDLRMAIDALSKDVGADILFFLQHLSYRSFSCLPSLLFSCLPSLLVGF